MDKVFIDYDGPQLFSCVSENGVRYLAVHAPPTENSDNWLYVRVSSTRLDRIMSGLVTLQNAFAKPEDDLVFVVSFQNVGDVLIKAENPILIGHDWFPAPGERLSDYPVSGYSSNGNAYGSLQTMDSLPDFLKDPAPMWEFRQDVLDYLRSVRTSVAEVAASTGRSVVDIMLKKGDYRSDLPAATLGKLLLSAQLLVDGLAPRYPVGVNVAGVREASRLDALAFFPGSFGVRLDTHDATLFTHPALATAVERIVILLASANDTTNLSNMLIEYGPKAAIRFRAFARAIERTDADLVIEVGIPGRSTQASAAISKAEVGRLVEFLDVEAKQVTDQFTFLGNLVGVSLRTKFFRLEDDENEFSGRIADDYLRFVRGKTIGGRYEANIKSVTDINEATGEERVKYTLIGLKEVE